MTDFEISSAVSILIDLGKSKYATPLKLNLLSWPFQFLPFLSTGSQQDSGYAMDAEVKYLDSNSDLPLIGYVTTGKSLNLSMLSVSSLVKVEIIMVTYLIELLWRPGKFPSECLPYSMCSMLATVVINCKSSVVIYNHYCYLLHMSTHKTPLVVHCTTECITVNFHLQMNFENTIWERERDYREFKIKELNPWVVLEKI